MNDVQQPALEALRFVRSLREQGLYEDNPAWETADELIRAALDALAAQPAEGIERDAARYRAIRCPAYIDWPLCIETLRAPNPEGYRSRIELRGERLDAAVDAAIAASGGGPK